MINKVGDASGDGLGNDTLNIGFDDSTALGDFEGVDFSGLDAINDSLQDAFSNDSSEFVTSFGGGVNRILEDELAT